MAPKKKPRAREGDTWRHKRYYPWEWEALRKQGQAAQVASRMSNPEACRELSRKGTAAIKAAKAARELTNLPVAVKLTIRQHARLRAWARQLGISAAAIMREAFSEWDERMVKERGEPEPAEGQGSGVTCHPASRQQD